MHGNDTAVTVMIVRIMLMTRMMMMMILINFDHFRKAVIVAGQQVKDVSCCRSPRSTIRAIAEKICPGCSGVA